MGRMPGAARETSAWTRCIVLLLLWPMLALEVGSRSSAWAAAVGAGDPHEALVIEARERLGLGSGPLPPFQPFAPVVVVPNGVVGSGRHGTWPNPGVGEDGNWTRVGIEIDALCGSRVIAAGDGRVVDLIDGPGDPHFASLGHMVLIEHPEDLLGRTLYSLYLHLAGPPPVAIGELVEAGRTTLGQVGDTGATSACRLHFELRFFPGRFHEAWRNIFGPGDRRRSPELAKDWLDPILFLRAFPEGLHRRAAPASVAAAEASLSADDLLRQIEQQIRMIAAQPDYLYAIDKPLDAAAVVWMDWMDRLDRRSRRRAEYDAAYLAASDALVMERVALEQAKRRVAAGELDLALGLLEEASRLRRQSDAWSHASIAIFTADVAKAEYWATAVYEGSKLAFVVTAGVGAAVHAATLPADPKTLALAVKTIEGVYLAVDGFLAWQRDGPTAAVCKTASSLTLKLLISEVELPEIGGEPGDRLVEFFNEHFAGRTLERALGELPFDTLPTSIDVPLSKAFDHPTVRPMLTEIFGRATTEGLEAVARQPIDVRCRDIIGPLLEAAAAGLRSLSTTPPSRPSASPEIETADTDTHTPAPPADRPLPSPATLPAPTEPLAGVQSSMAGGAVLTGSVRDNFGEPIAGARARIQGSALETLTNAEGHYLLPYVPGSFRVAINREGFDPTEFPLHLTQAARFPVEAKTIVRQPPGSGIFFHGTGGWEPLNRCTIEQVERDHHVFSRAGVDRFVARGTPTILAAPPVVYFLDATDSRSPEISPFFDRIERYYLFSVAPDGTFLRDERRAGWDGWLQRSQRGLSPYKRLSEHSVRVRWGTIGAGRPTFSSELSPGIYAIVSPNLDRCFLAHVTTNRQSIDLATVDAAYVDGSARLAGESTIPGSRQENVPSALPQSCKVAAESCNALIFDTVVSALEALEDENLTVLLINPNLHLMNSEAIDMVDGLGELVAGRIGEAMAREGLQRLSAEIATDIATSIVAHIAVERLADHYEAQGNAQAAASLRLLALPAFDMFKLGWASGAGTLTPAGLVVTNAAIWTKNVIAAGKLVIGLERAARNGTDLDSTILRLKEMNESAHRTLHAERLTGALFEIDQQGAPLNDRMRALIWEILLENERILREAVEVRETRAGRINAFITGLTTKVGNALAPY